MSLRVVLLLCFFVVQLFSSVRVFAQTRITVLHTSDIHGHFYNLDSPIRLGGVARLKTKIDEVRLRNSNHILLDSGDWTEGTIFYTLNSGEANHRLMEHFNYDAIVLGNHEWLVGPKDLYEGFKAAGFNIPVLAANVDTSRLPAEIPLSKYLKPYVIKEVSGKRVGILGLSTFEIIYDPFFEPAQVLEPTKVALRYVKKLRDEEKCDVVIVLTHLGINADKEIAQSVPGIDLIVGGHTHILLNKPVIVNNVPIVHVGFWAQYLGEYELYIEKSGRVSLASHKIHQVDETIPENLMTASIVDGFKKRIEEIRGKIFDDQIFSTNVNLPLGKGITEETLGNWATDAIRLAGKTDFALDVGQFFRRSLYAGVSSTFDFFSMFPHVYSSQKNKNWTVYTMEVRGNTLEQLMSLFIKFGIGVKVSQATYKIDGDEAIFPIKNFIVNKEKVEANQFYKIAATEGVLTAFNGLKKVGADVGVRNIKDTGVEAWSAIRSFVVKKTPVTTSKTQWEGRVRTVQPDIHIPLEQVLAQKIDDKTVQVNYQIINAGMEKAILPKVTVTLDTTPKNTLDEKWVKLEELPANNSYLKPGQKLNKQVLVKSPVSLSGIYPIQIEAIVVSGEYNSENNKVMGYFHLQ